MSQKPKKYLVLRLFLSYLWITIAAVVTIGAYGAYMAREAYLERTAEDLEARARLCAQQIAEPLLTDDEAVGRLCKQWAKSIGTRITVIRTSGEVVADSNADPKTMDNHGTRPEVREALADGDGVGVATHYSHTLQEGRMYVAVAVDDGPASPFVVRASLPITAINQRLVSITNHILVVGLVATALIALVSIWLALRIGRPLQQLKAAAEHYAHGELDYQIPDSDEEGINEVAGAMNRMAKELDRRMHATDAD
ncbi:MAG: HAMP domain-containing protein [Pirellulales bacterium]|nr:HAMP domain-containing protein [Pirellulales bacterium]